MGMTLRSNGVPIAFSTRLPSRKQMEKQWWKGTLNCIKAKRKLME